MSVAFAPASLVATGGPPHLIANSPIPASVVIICCGMDVLLVQPFGSDCSSNVNKVVVGESASIAKPWRSTCVRIVLASTGGMLENKLGSSAEKEKMWAVAGDLYTVLSKTASRGLGTRLHNKQREKTA